MRKPVFGVSDQVRHKTDCTVTENDHRFEISDLGGRRQYCTIGIAKTKALISFAVTAKLICVFVFAYEKSRFSHDEAHLNSALNAHNCPQTAIELNTIQIMYITISWSECVDTRTRPLQ